MPNEMIYDTNDNCGLEVYIAMNIQNKTGKKRYLLTGKYADKKSEAIDNAIDRKTEQIE